LPRITIQVAIHHVRPRREHIMARSSGSNRRGLTRRGFLVGAAAGAAAGLPLGFLGKAGLEWLERHNGLFGPRFTGETQEVKRPAYAMPGPFPGRVVEVRRADAVRPDHSINADAVNAMIDCGMTELTGADEPQEAWRRFFEKDDVIGIKVNPVGRKPKPGEGGRVPYAVGAISNPEVLLKVVRSLRDLGVKPQNIIVFERYAQEFYDAGYDRVMYERDLDGVHWYASAARYHDRQVNIEGFDEDRSNFPPELVKHVVGYDPDVFVRMGFAAPQHDPKDDRSFRTHLSMIVSRMVNKIITLPVLKDHRSAGVTLAIKNLSHGMNCNVARSHINAFARPSVADGTVTHVDSSAASFGDGTAAVLPMQQSGPNQCNTFIPTAASQHRIRQKATLHILDGLIGVYEGGPGNWNQTWATWRRQSLFFATDPVALDHVGWDIIDAQRVAEGWQPVANMGLLHYSESDAPSAALAGLATSGPADAIALAAASKNHFAGRATESFDSRQPQHIILAERLGMGVFDAAGIEHRVVRG
jgi:hypothetical protein